MGEIKFMADTTNIKREINKSFPDPEKLLETAYDAIERFAAENVPAADDKLVIASKKNSTLSEEEYSITISAAGVTLQAADTEGLRRAVYNFLDICPSCESIIFISSRIYIQITF